VSFAYLCALLVSLGGVALIDRRHRLFLWHAPVRAAIVLGAGVAFLLAWDLAGIGLGIFFRAETRFMTGVLIAPELPLEEPVFLLFLCQLTMVMTCGSQRLLRRRRPSSGAGEERR
jgi:lycopene cyclase domain-containing protein